MNVPLGKPRATLDDLMRFDGAAELVDGEIVPKMGTGHRHGRRVFHLVRSLGDHVDAVGRGLVYGDGTAFAVPELSSGRESFVPDAAYYTGLPPADAEDFIPGAPDFAVEVRSKNDRGPAAEAEMADKHADYFEAGTLVVWDVEPEARVVRRYRKGEPEPALFAAGDAADAEPAVPGWRVAVDELMAS